MNLLLFQCFEWTLNKVDLYFKIPFGLFLITTSLVLWQPPKLYRIRVRLFYHLEFVDVFFIQIVSNKKHIGVRISHFYTVEKPLVVLIFWWKNFNEKCMFLIKYNIIKKQDKFPHPALIYFDYNFTFCKCNCASK